MGKGSGRRPAQVPQDTFRKTWDETFAKPTVTTDGPPPKTDSLPAENVDKP